MYFHVFHRLWPVLACKDKGMTQQVARQRLVTVTFLYLLQLLRTEAGELT